MTHMQYAIDGVFWEDDRPASTPTFLSSPHGYLVASISGAQVAYGAEHLIGKMGGLWFHPVRIGGGWQLRVDGQLCADAVRCRVTETTIERIYDRAGYAVTVVEHMDTVCAALIVTIDITSKTALACTYAIEVCVDTDLEGCWFGGMQAGQTVTLTDAARVVGVRASGGDITAGVAVAAAPAMTWQHANGQLCGTGTLSSNGRTPAAQTWVLVCDHTHSPLPVAQSVIAAMSAAAQRRTPITTVQPTRFTSTDTDLNAYWRVACQNMVQLDAQYPDMPRYALAGIPEYPQFFGCDTTYSIPGLLAAGLADVAKSALDGLAARAQAACGRVPHEITTNGRVYHPGNAQETPQFAVACWQYVCWTGDLQAARRWYGVCAEGMTHVAGVLHGEHWPYGDGMVERHGMGPFKLDSVCYILQALDALSRWADALGMADAAVTWKAARQRLVARFDAAWWMPEAGLYADSLHRDGRQQLDYHWTAIVPVQTAGAPQERLATVYAHVKNQLTNQWGLMHTGGTEDSVWTLPTGLLAVAAFSQNDTAYGVELLKNIGVTARHGSLGLMKELIPEGLCFVQLWSAALYCQGIVEGLVGFVPDLLAQTITLSPRVLPSVGALSIQGLVCGDHRFDISVDAQGVQVVHLEGPGMLTWHLAGGHTRTTVAGQNVVCTMQRMEE